MTQENKMENELDVIEPEYKSLVFGGKGITIRPLVVCQIPGVTRALRGVAIGEDMDIMSLIADHGDSLIDAVAIATGMKRSEIENASPVEFIELVRAVIEVNTDFFVDQIAPVLMDGIGAITDTMAKIGAGQTPFKH